MQTYKYIVFTAFSYPSKRSIQLLWGNDVSDHIFAEILHAIADYCAMSLELLSNCS